MHKVYFKIRETKSKFRHVIASASSIGMIGNSLLLTAADNIFNFKNVRSLLDIQISENSVSSLDINKLREIIATDDNKNTINFYFIVCYKEDENVENICSEFIVISEKDNGFFFYDGHTNRTIFFKDIKWIQIGETKFKPYQVSAVINALKETKEVPGGKGEDGKSAYEIAVEHGYEGTEEEWLESLSGDKEYTEEEEANIIKYIDDLFIENKDA